MKKLTISALILASTFALTANADILKITLVNGAPIEIDIDNISEMTFEESAPAPETLTGNYTGSISLAVGAMATYNTDITVSVNENADGSIDFTYPEYKLANTLMGDLTLGTVTIKNIPYDESKGGWYLNYSDAGLKQHFESTSGMNNDYVLGNLSEITVTKTATGIKVVNPFKLGAMPFPITATLEAAK